MSTVATSAFNRAYIDGRFVTPHGKQVIDLVNPASNEVIGEVTLADAIDTRNAVAAAKRAFKSFSRTTARQRMDWLQRLHDSVARRMDDLVQATVLEYGAPQERARGSNNLAANIFLHFRDVLAEFDFATTAGRSTVVHEPLGVVGVFTPWNSSAGSIAIKVAPAIAAGCTVVVKPSEMSAMQTEVLMECFHEAGLPPGVVNFVTGLGEVVGAELTRHPDVAKIAFTGSTPIGKLVAKSSLDTMKRFTLELGGKSANIILDDADFSKAIPMAVNACFLNNGQACIAASRLFVPEDRLDEVKRLIVAHVRKIRVGDPSDPAVTIGPVASRKQYERVQEYIRSGIQEGAELVAGGPGLPQGLERGNFVRPTVFAGVDPGMKISREEIFGPVLSVLTYRTEAQAIEMANDSAYGLMAYVSSSDPERALRVARSLDAGRVLINTLSHDPLAPFGGFKQSGIGREGGVFGLKEFLEPKAIITE
ncbi:MAG TPA: aldehyde dehydrogenase family protein [Usitatibacter sp.]|jgi:aldehyde dehydrogenase (NAD+)|nr:aldehyde dehydrogenase family protein [Usitatibacter sp.]